jgi:hypothetical protein
MSEAMLRSYGRQMCPERSDFPENYAALRATASPAAPAGKVQVTVVP